MRLIKLIWPSQLSSMTSLLRGQPFLGLLPSAEAIEGVQMQRKVLLIVAKDAVDIGKGLSR